METNNKKNKYIFPMSVFFLLLLIEIIVISSGISFYFYITGKKNVNDIEKYTLSYSKTLAESFSRISDSCYKNRNFNPLRDLFHKKIESDTIDEAFFVLKNGKLVVHSNTKTKRKLKGNIANDEMSYNIDMILAPLNKRNRQLTFSNYNIIGETIPFNRKQKELIGKYVYKNINSNGWIFTKATFSGKHPIGTVNFIISKKRIHDSILYHYTKAKSNIAIGLFVSFFISLVVSVYVMFRYKNKSIQTYARKSMENQIDPENIEIDISENISVEDEIITPDSQINDDLDFILDEPLDEELVLEDDSDEPEMEFDFSINEDGKIEFDNEYITVEYLGEIDEEESSDEAPAIKKLESDGSLIARVISSESINPEMIKDAIPLERKGR